MPREISLISSLFNPLMLHFRIESNYVIRNDSVQLNRESAKIAQQTSDTGINRYKINSAHT